MNRKVRGRSEDHGGGRRGGSHTRAGPSSGGREPASVEAAGSSAVAAWRFWPPATRWLVGAGLLLSLALLLRHAAEYWFLTDDAYISFRYARNLSHGFGLVFNPGFERVEGYSNFLWVLLLSSLDRVGVVPERGAGILSVAATVGLWATVAWFAIRGARDLRTAWVALVPLLFLAATRSIAVWSSSGLETRWFELLIVAGALRLVVETERQLRRERPSALSPWLFALAVWTRPDGMLFAGTAFVAAALVLHRRGQLELARYLRGWLPFVLLVGGQLVFRRLYYGDWLPNTYYAKVAGRIWWGSGMRYLAAFALEYAGYLWIPLLAAAVLAHRARRTQFVPALFACLILPHAVYVAAIGGDHFEFRPLDLYFPFVFLLLADGARYALERPRLAPLAMANLALVLVGLWEIPWQSHRQFPRQYLSGFPGQLDAVEAREWLSPDRDPIYGLPGLRPIAAAHQGLIRSLSSNYVGLRAEEHRAFLATVIPDGVRMRQLIDQGLLPRDLHVATGCIGAMPYYADVRTLDLLGLTDAYVAHQPFRQSQFMGHDKFAPDNYVAQRDVDLRAVAGIHPFVGADSPGLVGMAWDAVTRRGPWYAAEVGGGDLLVCGFPRGADEAIPRMPRLRFQWMADSSFAKPLFRRSIAAIRDSLRRRPKDLDGRMMFGDLMLYLERFPEAAAAYEQVLSAGVESPRLRSSVAEAYERSGRADLARPSLERALEMARSAGDVTRIADLERRLASYGDRSEPRRPLPPRHP